MSGSIFDIIGPVMVGPSSSHTAGAVRLASLARLVAGQGISSIEFVLYNSFAKTYQGHGTDRGLVAGILGFAVDDDRIREAFAYAEQAGLNYTITPFEGRNQYSPNTVMFKMVLAHDEKLTLVGHSIGGGKVYISKINDYNVALRGELPTIIMFYKDQPGMIWQVTKIIAECHVNIASLHCARNQRGVDAFMEICLDTMLPQEAVEAIRQIADVYIVRNVDKLAS